MSHTSSGRLGTRAPQAPADVDVLGVLDHSGPKIEALVPFLTSSPGVRVLVLTKILGNHTSEMSIRAETNFFQIQDGVEVDVPVRPGID